MTTESEIKKDFFKVPGSALKGLIWAAISVYGIGVITAVVVALVYFWPFSWLSSGGEGLVLLETPQIFTRGRLVNDRALEQAWLEEQLVRTKTLLETDRFAKPDSIRFARRSLSLSLRSGEQPQGLVSVPIDDETKKKMATIGLMASPHEQFEDAARYRATIRNYLMSTVLDDRHDIEGNTIYRFNFNATVLPPKGSANVAMVVVHLLETNPNPAPDKSQDLDSIYVELLHDWRARLQETLDAVIDDRMATIEEFDLPLEPVENNQFSAWLIERGRSELADLLGVKSDEIPDAFLQQLPLEYSDVTRRIERRNVASQFKGPLEPFLMKSPAPHQLLDFVIDTCQRGTFDANALFPPSDPKRDLAPIRCRQAPSSLFTKLEILDSIKLLRRTPAVAKKCFASGDLSELVIAVALPPLDKPRSKCGMEGILLNSQRSFAVAQKRRMDIVAAFEAHYMVNKAPKSQRAQVRAGRGKLPGEAPINTNLGMFFKASPPPPCAPGACKPIIDFSSGDLMSSARTLIGLVEPTTRAFTYSVMPSKFVHRSEARQRSDQDVGAGAAAAGKPAVSAQTSTNSDAVGRENDPLVVGFGDWGTTPRAVTKFGWALFPRSTLDGSIDKQQTPENYSVSAMVSLPGWWKTAYFKVDTCWVSESDVKRIVDPDTMCVGKSSVSKSFDVRLPGDAWELMQHLRFEVIRTPYLERPVGSHAPVEVGRKASVMIRGGRLWRSPVVKVGNQQADRIEVLPDMKGIIAHFKCLEPPPGMGTTMQNAPAGYGPGASEAHLHVITSEGRTPFPLTVVVKPFALRAGESFSDACWMKAKKDD